MLRIQDIQVREQCAALHEDRPPDQSSTDTIALVCTTANYFSTLIAVDSGSPAAGQMHLQCLQPRQSRQQNTSQKHRRQQKQLP